MAIMNSRYEKTAQQRYLAKFKQVIIRIEPTLFIKLKKYADNKNKSVNSILITLIEELIKNG